MAQKPGNITIDQLSQTTTTKTLSGREFLESLRNNAADINHNSQNQNAAGMQGNMLHDSSAKVPVKGSIDKKWEHDLTDYITGKENEGNNVHVDQKAPTSITQALKRQSAEKYGTQISETGIFTTSNQNEVYNQFQKEKKETLNTNKRDCYTNQDKQHRIEDQDTKDKEKRLQIKGRGHIQDDNRINYNRKNEQNQINEDQFQWTPGKKGANKQQQKKISNNQFDRNEQRNQNSYSNPSGNNQGFIYEDEDSDEIIFRAPDWNDQQFIKDDQIQQDVIVPVDMTYDVDDQIFTYKPIPKRNQKNNNSKYQSKTYYSQQSGQPQETTPKKTNQSYSSSTSKPSSSNSQQQSSNKQQNQSNSTQPNSKNTNQPNSAFVYTTESKIHHERNNTSPFLTPHSPDNKSPFKNNYSSYSRNNQINNEQQHQFVYNKKQSNPSELQPSNIKPNPASELGNQQYQSQQTSYRSPQSVFQAHQNEQQNLQQQNQQQVNQSSNYKQKNQNQNQKSFDSKPQSGIQNTYSSKQNEQGKQQQHSDKEQNVMNKPNNQQQDQLYVYKPDHKSPSAQQVNEKGMNPFTYKTQKNQQKQDISEPKIQSQPQQYQSKNQSYSNPKTQNLQSTTGNNISQKQTTFNSSEAKGQLISNSKQEPNSTQRQIQKQDQEGKYHYQGKNSIQQGNENNEENEKSKQKTQQAQNSQSKDSKLFSQNIYTSVSQKQQIEKGSIKEIKDIREQSDIQTVQVQSNRQQANNQFKQTQPQNQYMSSIKQSWNTDEPLLTSFRQTPPNYRRNNWENKDQQNNQLNKNEKDGEIQFGREDKNKAIQSNQDFRFGRYQQENQQRWGNGYEDNEQQVGDHNQVINDSINKINSYSQSDDIGDVEQSPESTQAPPGLGEDNILLIQDNDDQFNQIQQGLGTDRLSNNQVGQKANINNGDVSTAQNEIFLNNQGSNSLLNNQQYQQHQQQQHLSSLQMKDPQQLLLQQQMKIQSQNDQQPIIYSHQFNQQQNQFEQQALIRGSAGSQQQQYGSQQNAQKGSMVGYQGGYPGQGYIPNSYGQGGLFASEVYNQAAYQQQLYQQQLYYTQMAQQQGQMKEYISDNGQQGSGGSSETKQNFSTGNASYRNQ